MTTLERVTAILVSISSGVIIYNWIVTTRRRWQRKVRLATATPPPLEASGVLHGGLKGSIEAHAKLVPPKPVVWIRNLWQRLQDSLAFLFFKMTLLVLMVLGVWVLGLGLLIKDERTLPFLELLIFRDERPPDFRMNP